MTGRRAKIASMGALTKRSLDWIDEAPIALEGSATTSASPQQVFAVLADHERWPEWFPNVRKVIVTGAASGVGATRRVLIPGMAVDEEFIAWEPGVRWSFTGTSSNRPVFASLLEDCRLEPTADGGCSIRYTMHLEPTRLAAPLLRLLAGRVRRSVQQGVDGLAERAKAAAPAA